VPPGRLIRHGRRPPGGRRNRPPRQRAPIRAGGQDQGKGESKSFFDSLTILRKGLEVDESFERLGELSHDIYYGLKIAEDYDTVRSLLCFASTDRVFIAQGESAVLKRAQLAALTISGALRNNPKAVAEVGMHWVKLTGLKCYLEDGSDILHSTLNFASQWSETSQCRKGRRAVGTWSRRASWRSRRC
jgi:hypothetical protein